LIQMIVGFGKLKESRQLASIEKSLLDKADESDSWDSSRAA